MLALVQKEPEARIFVAYLRVSTARQGESGLGLEAVAAKGRDADGTGN